MQECVGNMWSKVVTNTTTYPIAKMNTKNVILCTTNSIKKKDGTLVMGAGTAKRACDFVTQLPKLIGDSIVTKEDYYLRIFLEHGIGCIQTKRFWGDPSPIDLVEDSLIRLSIIATAMPTINFHLPRPGCGLGGLKWEDVKKIANVLPNNCFVWDIEDDKRTFPTKGLGSAPQI